ncbi:MAG TPA: aspartate aminotransferase family protein [Acidobacteriota bacterium]
MGTKVWLDEEKAQLKKAALTYIIPHFSSNASLAQGAKIFTRGEGCYLYDIDGKRYLDTFASLLTTVCGHQRSEIADAILQQANELEFFPNYEDTFTVPLIELSTKLAEIMPGDLCVSFFVNSGSEANETAIKMARQYHWERGERHRYKIIARQGSYHGTTLGTISATGLPWFRTCFEPLLPGVLFAPAARRDGGTSAEAPLEEIEKIINWEGAESIAAIIMDPIPGSNSGYPQPPDGYLKGVRELCSRYGILLIFDEVQTGFGKTGKWFACQHWDVVPDIMTIGKGFTGGYLPLGATVTTLQVAHEFRKGPGHELRSGSTYGGHPLACAATLANIRMIEKENLVDRAASLGQYLQGALDKLHRYPIVSAVRGIGLLWAVELRSDCCPATKIQPAGALGGWIRQWCYDHGMILRNNGDLLVLAPALVIKKEEIDQALALLNQAIPAAMQHFGLTP